MECTHPRWNRRSRGWLVGIALALGSATAAAQAPDDLVVFGDSLSDAGNVWLATHEVVKAPFEPVPARPYAIGGHHFSNGKTWIEQLAGDLGLAPDARPALAKAPRFSNYAFGGARARAGSGSASPSSAEQVGLYLLTHGGVADPGALYVVSFGGNDVRDALAVAQSDPGAAMTIVTEAAATLVADVQTLYAAGARRFLVGNCPDLSKAPAVIASGGATAAEFFASTLNGMLEDGLLGLEADPAFAELELARLDLFFVLGDMVAHPGDYGIADPFVPCLTFFVKGGAVCDEPELRLFWDGIHPTTTGHRGLADAALAALGLP